MEGVAPPSASPADSPSRPRNDSYRGGRGRGARRGRGTPFNDNQMVGDRRPENQNRGGQRGWRGGKRGAIDGEVERTRLSAMEQLSLSPHKMLQPSTGKAKDEGGEEGVEAEVCFICASEVVHNAVAPCNHRTCHICALRMRALYKTKDCAHCRVSTISVNPV